MLPWQEGRSIYEAVAAGEQELPDEPPHDPSRISWAPGAWDGVVTHHVAPQEEGRLAGLRRLVRRERDPAKEIAGRVVQLVAEPTDEARLALYEAAQHPDLVAHLDAVIAKLADRGLEREAIAPHARWLVTQSRHRGPVKLGLALLGVAGGPDDIAAVETLAAHDELTLYCSVALQNLVDDPVEALWAVARTARGWGKIDAVERLVQDLGERPDIRRWLLTDGCENEIMNEYLALECATAGGLAAALEGEVDDDLLDGACTIVEALASDASPAGDLSHYDDADVAVSRLLDALERTEITLHRLLAVVALERWYEEHPDLDLRARCRAILEAPGWEARLRDAYVHGDEGDRGRAWHAARAVGADLWDLGFEQLRRDGPSFWNVFTLMHDAGLERQTRVVRLLEEALPEELGALEPAIAGGELFSERLVAAALGSPVVRLRNVALAALEETPRERWGEAAEALQRLAREEPDREVRERARALL